MALVVVEDIFLGCAPVGVNRWRSFRALAKQSLQCRVADAKFFGCPPPRDFSSGEALQNNVVAGVEASPINYPWSADLLALPLLHNEQEYD